MWIKTTRKNYWKEDIFGYQNKELNQMIFYDWNMVCYRVILIDDNESRTINILFRSNILNEILEYIDNYIKD